MQKTISLLTVSLLLLALPTAGFAANTRKGKKTYNQVCRSCHIRGGEGGRLAPSVKTKAEWQQFIEQNLHKAYPQIIDDLNDSGQQDLLRFLQDYAADSKGAETCG